MYSVVYLNIERDSSFQATLFRSMVERDCWNFVRRRLEHMNPHVRFNASKLHVIDGADQFCEAPEDVRALTNYVRLAS